MSEILVDERLRSQMFSKDKFKLTVNLAFRRFLVEQIKPPRYHLLGMNTTSQFIYEFIKTAQQFSVVILPFIIATPQLVGGNTIIDLYYTIASRVNPFSNLVLSENETIFTLIRWIGFLLMLILPALVIVSMYLKTDEFTNKIVKNEHSLRQHFQTHKMTQLLRLILGDFLTIPILLFIIQGLNCQLKDGKVVSFYNSNRQCYFSPGFSKLHIFKAIVITFYMWFGWVIRKTHFNRRIHNTHPFRK